MRNTLLQYMMACQKGEPESLIIGGIAHKPAGKYKDFTIAAIVQREIYMEETNAAERGGFDSIEDAVERIEELENTEDEKLTEAQERIEELEDIIERSKATLEEA